MRQKAKDISNKNKGGKSRYEQKQNKKEGEKTRCQCVSVRKGFPLVCALHGSALLTMGQTEIFVLPGSLQEGKFSKVLSCYDGHRVPYGQNCQAIDLAQTWVKNVFSVCGLLRG